MHPTHHSISASYHEHAPAVTSAPKRRQYYNSSIVYPEVTNTVLVVPSNRSFANTTNTPPPLAVPIYKRKVDTNSPDYEKLPTIAQTVFRNLLEIAESIKSPRTKNVSESIKVEIDTLATIATSLDDSGFLFVIEALLRAMGGLYIESAQFAPTFKHLITNVKKSPSLYLQALINHDAPHFDYFNELIPSIGNAEDQRKLLTFLQKHISTISLTERALTIFAGLLQDDTIKYQFLEYLLDTKLTRNKLYTILRKLELTNASDEMLVLFLRLAQKDATRENEKEILEFLNVCLTPDQMVQLQNSISYK
jgi:hypothetical protein